jgi:hypothetical protein
MLKLPNNIEYGFYFIKPFSANMELEAQPFMAQTLCVLGVINYDK